MGGWHPQFGNRIMAQITISQACNRIIQLTNEVSLHTRDWPQTQSAAELQKHLGTLTLAVNRLTLCVRNLSEGKKEAGPTF